MGVGWTSRMTPQEHELFLSYKWYIDAMEDVIVLIDGAENPVGIAKILTYAEENGEIVKRDEYSKMYVPNDP
jgi:hypothetical protein